MCPPLVPGAAAWTVGELCCCGSYRPSAIRIIPDQWCALLLPPTHMNGCEHSASLRLWLCILHVRSPYNSLPTEQKPESSFLTLL